MNLHDYINCDTPETSTALRVLCPIYVQKFCAEHIKPAQRFLAQRVNFPLHIPERRRKASHENNEQQRCLVPHTAMHVKVECARSCARAASRLGGKAIARSESTVPHHDVRKSGLPHFDVQNFVHTSGQMPHGVQQHVRQGNTYTHVQTD